MRYVRYQSGDETSYGILEAGVVHQIDGDLFGTHRRTWETRPLAQVRLLAPCRPGKIIAIGLNYRSHLGNRATPARPEMFLKTPTSVQHPGADIVIPRISQGNVHFEGELVLVIGRRGKHISVAQAAAHIFGYTCGNDVSERDWQGGPDRDLQWARAKSSDTFSPFGPVIATDVDPHQLHLQTRLNGQVMQSQTTGDLIYNAFEIVAHCSQTMTLEPGDVIFTGTPGQTQRMRPGDVVEVELDQIGVLRNTVTAEE